jgi:hypothetical protein
MVRIGGDIRTVMPRGEFNPVSWPEIDVLRTLHGDEAVTDVKPIAKVQQTAKAEKLRLTHIYGAATVEDVFPGKNPQMELDMPGAKLPDPPVAWHNPIDVDPAAHGLADPTAPKAASAKAAKPLPFN